MTENQKAGIEFYFYFSATIIIIICNSAHKTTIHTKTFVVISFRISNIIVNPYIILYTLNSIFCNLYN
nr:MAG TPA: hypothetical protein [Caudoviricetes sp.]